MSDGPVTEDGKAAEAVRPWAEVTQTILYDPDDDLRGAYGNCLQAAVASVLRLPLDAVPHFVTFTWWDCALELWLRGRNLTMVQRTIPAHGQIPNEPGLVCIVGGKSPRGVDHAVVAYEGEIVWDPHPSRAGLVTIDDATWFRKWEHPSIVQCWLCRDAGTLETAHAEASS